MSAQELMTSLFLFCSRSLSTLWLFPQLVLYGCLLICFPLLLHLFGNLPGCQSCCSLLGCLLFCLTLCRFSSPLLFLCHSFPPCPLLLLNVLSCLLSLSDIFCPLIFNILYLTLLLSTGIALLLPTGITLPPARIILLYITHICEVTVLIHLLICLLQFVLLNNIHLHPLILVCPLILLNDILLHWSLLSINYLTLNQYCVLWHTHGFPLSNPNYLLLDCLLL